MSFPSGSNFCSNCGSALAPSDSFCSRCGSAVGGAGSTAGSDDLRRRIEDLTVEGWEVEHDYGDRVVMIDHGFGSWGVHVLLLVFTGGLGNIPYAWYNYSPGADRIELRADGTERYVQGGGSSGAGESSESDDGTLRTAGSVFLSFMCALVGLAIFNNGVGSLPELFIATTFIAVALFAFPPIRRRLEERESVTKFGRVRSTDETVVRSPDVPCAACARPVETGVERTFHETFYLAGIPLVTDEQGSNCYCRSCAQGDPFTEHAVDEPDREFGGGDRDREKEPDF